MAFFNNALRVEQRLGKVQEGFPAVWGWCYWHKVCWPGSHCMCPYKKGRGSGHHGVLGIFAWKHGRGIWCHGCLRYCYQRFGEPWEGARAWNICLETGTGELVPRGGCDIATNASGSPGKGNVLGIFAWKQGRGIWCHGVPAILLPTFRGALGRGTCLEYLFRKRDGGVGAMGWLRYCYQLSGEPREGTLLGIVAWTKGWGSWCHGVPAILLPTFQEALGRGGC